MQDRQHKLNAAHRLVRLFDGNDAAVIKLMSCVLRHDLAIRGNSDQPLANPVTGEIAGANSQEWFKPTAPLKIVADFDSMTEAGRINCRFGMGSAILFPAYQFLIEVEALLGYQYSARIVLPTDGGYTKAPLTTSLHRWSGQHNGLVIHVPTGGFRYGVGSASGKTVIAIYMNRSSENRFCMAQSTCCSLMAHEAMTPNGATTGYFGSSPTVGVQFVLSRAPLAAYTDDAYTEVSVASSAIPASAYRSAAYNRDGTVDVNFMVSVGDVRFQVETYSAGYRGFVARRKYDNIDSPAELVQRTGEKKGSDISRFGGTRKDEVVGQYVHYNEVIVDPTSVAKLRFVRLWRSLGRAFAEPLTVWLPRETLYAQPGSKALKTAFLTRSIIQEMSDDGIPRSMLQPSKFVYRCSPFSK